MTALRITISDISAEVLSPDHLAPGRLSLSLSQCRKRLEVVYDPSYLLCKVANEEDYVIIMLGVSAADPESYIPKLKPLIEETHSSYDGLDGCSFAVIDKQKGYVWLLRDVFGLHYFYYTYKDEVLCIAASLEALLENSCTSPLIDQEYCVDFLLWPYASDVDTSRSPYVGISKVPKGALTKLLDGNSQTKLLSLRMPSTIRYKRLKDYHMHLNSLLTSLIKEYVSLDPHRIAILLSGGLDSTLVTGVTKHVLEEGFGASPMTISFTYDSPADESNWIRLAVDYFNLPRSLIVDNSGFYDYDSRIKAFPRFSEPHISAAFFSSSMRQMHICRESGVRVVFTGHGGDGYGTSTGFLRDLFTELRLGKLLECAMIYSRQQHKSLFSIFKVLKRVDHAYNRALISAISCSRQLSALLDRQENLIEVACRHFQGKAGLTHLALRVLFQTVTPHIHNTYFAPRDMVFLSPLRDIRLLLFYAAMPTDVLFRLTFQRSGFREACGDLIPPEIRARTTKRGFNKEYFVGLRDFREVIGTISHDIRTCLHPFLIQKASELLDDVLNGVAPPDITWSFGRLQTLIYWLINHKLNFG